MLFTHIKSLSACFWDVVKSSPVNHIYELNFNKASQHEKRFEVEVSVAATDQHDDVLLMVNVGVFIK